ncbi:sensor histidine kinase [Sphaerisporangium corydalis]|uniref:histidine kinase n=1 Tax=Sphaerisporangium corydalis TaxID=1441875 RepID=A0ABV9EAR0_9ACTN|nr:histidine kinase [Sphaerisporangium corydalis]
MTSRAGAVLQGLARPLTSAVVTGTADPPFPRSPRLRPRTPAFLPFRSVDLVAAADVLLAWILYGTGLSYLLTEAEASRFAGDQPVLYVLAAAYSLPVALRDRWPLAAWRLSALSVLAGAALNPGGTLPYVVTEVTTYLLCAYSVSVRSGRDTTIGVWAVTVLGAWIIHPNSMFMASILVTIVVLFGYNVSARRRATTRLAEEERHGEEQRAARALLEERARIARELHDVVAHHMSVIAIQAEATPLQAAGDPGRLEEGLAGIRVLSLAALAEMRQVLGALRGDDGRRETAPQPGLAQVADLAGNARAGGLAVSVRVEGPLDAPAAAGLSAYRIVQESLSNAMRHAPGSSVTVEITRTATELRLRVANGPRPRAAALPAEGPATGGGQGIIGMRERAVLLGGTLDAAPGPDGGFTVTAALPLASPLPPMEER